MSSQPQSKAKSACNEHGIYTSTSFGITYEEICQAMVTLLNNLPIMIDIDGEMIAIKNIHYNEFVKLYGDPKDYSLEEFKEKLTAVMI